MTADCQPRGSGLRSRILAAALSAAFAGGGCIAQAATVDADSLRQWVSRSETRLRANESEGIENESMAWIARLDRSQPPQPELLVEALRIRLAARGARGLGGEDVTLRTAQRVVALIQQLAIVDSRTVAAWIGLGSALSIRGDYVGAARPLERAASLADSLDPGSALLGTALSHQAWNLRLLGRLDEAEAVAQRSLKVREDLGPDQAASTSWNYSQLASIALARGALDRALEYNRAGLRLREELFGPQSVWTGDACEMHGWILTQRGDYPRADEFYLRALAIFESTVGQDSDRTARILNDLGVCASYQAQNDVARRYYERSLDIRSRLYGPSNVSVAQALHNLGIVLADMGDYEAALERQRHALEILGSQGALGSEDALLCRNAIVRLLIRDGAFDEARQVAEAALADATRSLGRGSIPALSARLLLVDIERNAGALERALAEADTSVVLGDASGIEPVRAQALDARARIFRKRGSLDLALSDVDSALALRTRAFGIYHPDTVRSSLLRGELALERGNPRRAAALAIQAEIRSQFHARSLFDGFAERQALRYAAERPTGLPLAVRCLKGQSGGGTQLWSLWDAIKDSRQLVLRAMSERALDARALASGPRRRLHAARGRVARLVMTSLRPEGGSDPARLRAAVAERERLERAVGDSLDAAQSSPSGSDSTSVRDLVTELAPDQILVAFRRVGQENEARYVALLGSPEEDLPTLVDLGRATRIEEAISRWIEELSRGEVRPDRSAQASRRACREAGEDLRRLIWDPLALPLEKSFQILLVPDADIWKVPWGALPTGTDRYLVEDRPTLRVLLSERGAHHGALDPAGITRALTVGDVDYSGTVAALPGGVNLVALPGSREEADIVQQLWSDADPVALRGKDAEESRVRVALEVAELAHLATHALYLESSNSNSELVENPLLRGGLVLAGRTESGPDNDGWLSAEEICGLDLHRARLIVLSACSTAEGEAPAGEATLGLAWAFRVAGAQNLVLTGWEVGDRDARVWMEEFHRRLRGGAPLAVAAAQSSRWLLASLRQQGRSAHPHHWAAFRAIETDR